MKAKRKTSKADRAITRSRREKKTVHLPFGMKLAEGLAARGGKYIDTFDAVEFDGEDWSVTLHRK